MTTKLKYLLGLLAIAAVWASNQAVGSTDFTIGNGGLESFNVTWDHTTEDALAGGITLTHVSGTLPSTTTVCTDIGATVFLGSQYSFSDPAPFQGQLGIQPPWGANQTSADAMAAIQAAADIFYNHQGVLQGVSTTDKAALQLAVWAALYNTASGGGPVTTTGPRFTVNAGDSAAIAEANTWLGLVNPNASYLGYLLIPDPVLQNNLKAQEMFYNVTPVPEPATLVAGALLLLPFGASMLRVLRRSRTA